MRVTTDLHYIRKHILKQLAMTKWGRFRDLRPKNVDSNLYNYHLKQLIKDGFIEQVVTKGYRLSPMGLRYADHVSIETFEPRWQPKIITAFVAELDSEVLLWSKYKQPFIGKLSLPNGKMHYEDDSVYSAVQRELSYFMIEEPRDLKLAGTIEYRAFIDQVLVTHTIAHVFKGAIDRHSINSDRLLWANIDDLKTTDMSPGTRETIQAVRSSNDIFFEAHNIHW